MLFRSTTRTYTHYIPLAGLNFCSFYYPARLCHQYGEKQLIVEPTHGFQAGPLTQNFIQNLSSTWLHRTIRHNISLDGDITTDDHYKAWIQLQQTEQNEFIMHQKTRALFRISMQEMRTNKRKRT